MLSVEIPYPSTSLPRYPHFLSSFLFLSLLVCHIPPMGMKMLILSKESWDFACLSSFSPQIPHWISSMMCFSPGTGCKCHSIYNRSSPYIDHSRVYLLSRHTGVYVPFALLPPPLMGVHAQPSVKDKRTFWPRQIALEQGCSLPPPPHPYAPRTHTHRWTHTQTHCPSPSRVTREASVLGP